MNLISFFDKKIALIQKLFLFVSTKKNSNIIKYKTDLYRLIYRYSDSERFKFWLN